MLARDFKNKGFTIVELLIVIVVIAILAALAVVAYNGIQQRANNAARVQAASQIKKLVQLYVAEKGVYPFTGSACATVELNCTAYNGTVITNSNATLINNIATLGNLPKSVPIQTDTMYGILYNYRPNMTYNGEASKKVLMMYWLEGTGLSCGISDVVIQVAGTTEEPDPWVTSTSGRTSSSGGRTTCYVAI